VHHLQDPKFRLLDLERQAVQPQELEILIHQEIEIGIRGIDGIVSGIEIGSVIETEIGIGTEIVIEIGIGIQSLPERCSV
jgi:hypothetical protein